MWPLTTISKSCLLFPPYIIPWCSVQHWNYLHILPMCFCLENASMKWWRHKSVPLQRRRARRYVVGGMKNKMRQNLGHADHIVECITLILLDDSVVSYHIMIHGLLLYTCIMFNFFSNTEYLLNVIKCVDIPYFWIVCLDKSIFSTIINF